jgi:hypothetical protein
VVLPPAHMLPQVQAGSSMARALGAASMMTGTAGTAGAGRTSSLPQMGTAAGAGAAGLREVVTTGPAGKSAVRQASASTANSVPSDLAPAGPSAAGDHAAAAACQQTTLQRQAPQASPPHAGYGDSPKQHQHPQHLQHQVAMSRPGFRSVQAEAQAPAAPQQEQQQPSQHGAAPPSAALAAGPWQSTQQHDSHQPQPQQWAQQEPSATVTWLGQAQYQAGRHMYGGFTISSTPGSTGSATSGAAGTTPPYTARSMPAGTTAAPASLSLSVGQFFESSADAPGEGSRVYQLQACWLQLGAGCGAVALARARRLYRPQQTNVPYIGSSQDLLYASDCVEERLHLARPGVVLRKCEVVGVQQALQEVAAVQLPVMQLGPALVHQGLAGQHGEAAAQHAGPGGGVGSAGAVGGGTGKRYMLVPGQRYEHCSGKLVTGM